MKSSGFFISRVIFILLPVIDISNNVNAQNSLVTRGIRDTVKVNDTLHISLTDTSVNASMFNLLPDLDKAVIDFFKPYMLKNICMAGDKESSIYRQFLLSGERYKKEALKKFNFFMTHQVSIRRNYYLPETDTAEIKNIRFEQIPVYQLTPNIVKYKAGDNLRQYYSLDTSVIMYKALLKSRILGLAYYYPKQQRLSYAFLSDGQLLEYTTIKLKGLEPILIANSLSILSKTSRVLDRQLGYLNKNDQIIFDIYDTTGQVTFNNDPTQTYHYKEKKLLTIEAYFAERPTYLKNIITAPYSQLVGNK